MATDTVRDSLLDTAVLVLVLSCEVFEPSEPKLDDTPCDSLATCRTGTDVGLALTPLGLGSFFGRFLGSDRTHILGIDGAAALGLGNRLMAAGNFNVNF